MSDTGIMPHSMHAEVEPVPETKPPELTIQNFYLKERTRLEWAAGQVDQQVREIKAWVDSIAEQHRGRIQNQINQLNIRFGEDFQQAVTADLKAQGGKKKSFDYILGKAGWRKGKDTIDVADEKKAIAHAEMHHPQCVKSKLDKAAMKALYNDGKGELLDGTSFKPGRQEFFPNVEGKPLPPGVRQEIEKS